MNIQEQAQHEAIKTTLKTLIMNNNNLDFYQKQQAVNSIDAIAQEADLLVEMLKIVWVYSIEKNSGNWKLNTNRNTIVAP